MSDNKIKFTIDGKECIADEGLDLWKAAMLNGVFIPYLCHMKDVVPAGSCRICTVRSTEDQWLHALHLLQKI